MSELIEQYNELLNKERVISKNFKQYDQFCDSQNEKKTNINSEYNIAQRNNTESFSNIENNHRTISSIVDNDSSEFSSDEGSEEESD